MKTPTFNDQTLRTVLEEKNWCSAFEIQWASLVTSPSLPVQEWAADLYPYYGIRDPSEVARGLNEAGSKPPRPAWERLRCSAEDQECNPMTRDSATPSSPREAIKLLAIQSGLILPDGELNDKLLEFATGIVVLCAVLESRAKWSSHAIWDTLLKPDDGKKEGDYCTPGP